MTENDDEYDLAEGMRAVGSSMNIDNRIEFEFTKSKIEKTESYIEKKRECAFTILKGIFSRWRGPQYNYNDREFKGVIDRQIEEIINILKKGDNLEKFKAVLREFKENKKPRNTPEEWLPFFQSFISSFIVKIDDFRHLNDFWHSFIEKYNYTNSHIMSGPRGADTLINFIECIIFLTSTIISFEEDKANVEFEDERNIKTCIDCLTKWCEKYLGQQTFAYSNKQGKNYGPDSPLKTINDIVSFHVKEMFLSLKKAKYDANTNLYKKLLKCYYYLDYDVMQKNNMHRNQQMKLLLECRVLDNISFGVEKYMQSMMMRHGIFALRQFGPSEDSVNNVVRQYIKCYLDCMLSVFPQYKKFEIEPFTFGGYKKNRKYKNKSNKKNKKHNRKTKRQRM